MRVPVQFSGCRGRGREEEATAKGSFADVRITMLLLCLHEREVSSSSSAGVWSLKAE